MQWLPDIIINCSTIQGVSCYLLWAVVQKRFDSKQFILYFEKKIGCLSRVEQSSDISGEVFNRFLRVHCWFHFHCIWRITTIMRQEFVSKHLVQMIGSYSGFRVEMEMGQRNFDEWNVKEILIVGLALHESNPGGWFITEANYIGEVIISNFS